MRSQRIAIIVAVASLMLAAALPALAQEAGPPRVLSARDTLRINQVGSPELSPRRRVGRLHAQGHAT